MSRYRRSAGLEAKVREKKTKTPTHLHGDLPDGPGGVVAHGDKLGVQVQAQDGHELG